MSTLQKIMSKLDERNIALKIGSLHDRARIRYRLKSNTICNFEEFLGAIGDYYNYHFSTCNSNGGRLSEAEARQTAKNIVDQHYQRKMGSDIMGAYNDAKDGTNGGMRAILDIIADNLKMMSVERYIQNIFDRYVSPNSWEDKITIIRQLIDSYGHLFSSSIDRSNPERYAQNFQTIIRQLVENSNRTSHVLRTQ